MADNDCEHSHVTVREFDSFKKSNNNEHNSLATLVKSVESKLDRMQWFLITCLIGVIITLIVR